MSILDLLKQEKTTTSKQYERSMYQQQIKKRGRNGDEDEDDTFQTHLYSHSVIDPPPASTTTKFHTATTNNNNSNPNHHQKHSILNTQCFWWIRSSNFASHRLVLPRHSANQIHTSTSSTSTPTMERIVLCLAPPSQSIQCGEHFYIVPMEYTVSYSTCTDLYTWNEIRLVQSKLRTIAAQQNKGVLFFETYLGSIVSGNRNSRTDGTVWQARMEAVFVSRDIYEDAALYFRAALMEQAQEEGTKPNIIPIHTKTKPLYHTIPKNFPYFFIEYDDIAHHNDTSSSSSSSRATVKSIEKPNAYVLLLESNQFPKTFGVDTIASMMDVEPIRMRRHRSMISSFEEEQVVIQFLQRYDTILNQ